MAYTLKTLTPGERFPRFNKGDDSSYEGETVNT
jgi:hypothetical protein